MFEFLGRLIAPQDGYGLLFAKSLITGSLNLINCTVSGNKVTGTTGAAGAGVHFGMGTATSTRRILNCILENNTFFRIVRSELIGGKSSKFFEFFYY